MLPRDSRRCLYRAYLTKIDGDARGGAAISIRKSPAFPLNSWALVSSSMRLRSIIQIGPHEFWEWATCLV